MACTVEERRRKLIEVLELNPSSGGLTTGQFEQLKQQLENHDVFSLEGELGCTDIVRHVVDTGDHPLLSSPLEGFHLFTGNRFPPWWMRCYSAGYYSTLGECLVKPCSACP